MYIALKHPKWRVRAWELVHPAAREELLVALQEYVGILPFARDVVDIQIVGSYAVGCARVYSDIDVNIAFASWERQAAAYDEWQQAFDRVYLFNERVARLTARFQINVSFQPHSPNLKDYVICYSCTDRKLYNRREGEFKDHSYFWDRAAKLWTPFTKNTYVFETERDPFEADVAEWAAYYGENFQWLR